MEYDFFTKYRSVDPKVNAIAQYFYRINKTKNFINKAKDLIGLPRWDKALLTNGSSGSGRNMTDTSELIFVPFVRENENFVNTALIVQTSATDTAFKYICDWQYHEASRDDFESTPISSERIALTLMILDKEVFGHSDYNLTDTTLFDKYMPSSKKGLHTYISVEREPESSYDKNQKNQAMAMPMAYQATLSCPQCVSNYWQIIFTFNLNSVHNNWEFPTGGGSGGSSAPEPPECPESQGRNSTSTNPCGPSWVPVGGNYYDPNAGLGVFSNEVISTRTMTKINNWRINNLDTLGLDTCRRRILNKLIGSLGTSPLGAFLSKLDHAVGVPTTIDKFIVHFKTAPLTNAHGLTTNGVYDEITHEFEVDITLDSSTAHDATDIFIANTLLHETIHAYMIFMWKKLHQGATQAQLDTLKLETAFKDYVDTLRARDSLNPRIYELQSESIQHNYMADRLLEYMANIIKQFHNDPTVPDRYYWYLAWTGLTRKSVRTWKEHWPNFPSWPPSNPAPSNDSTRGLKYALTLNRIDTLYNQVYQDEAYSRPNARGRKPVTGGCY